MSTSSSQVVVLAVVAGLLLSACGAHGRREDELADGDDKDDCKSSGSLQASRSHSCAECCQAGMSYPTYRCSPAAGASGSGSTTKAIMTLNDFQEGGDGGGPSECDGKYHNNTKRVVALSTGWYAMGRRCSKKIRINANGGSVLAKVVDECDSTRGCDKEHAFQPPCRNNIVDASQAVWDALGITGEDVGNYMITWSDA